MLAPVTDGSVLTRNDWSLPAGYPHILRGDRRWLDLDRVGLSVLLKGGTVGRKKFGALRPRWRAEATMRGAVSVVLGATKP